MLRGERYISDGSKTRAGSREGEAYDEDDAWALLAREHGLSDADLGLLRAWAREGRLGEGIGALASERADFQQGDADGERSPELPFLRSPGKVTRAMRLGGQAPRPSAPLAPSVSPLTRYLARSITALGAGARPAPGRRAEKASRRGKRERRPARGRPRPADALAHAREHGRRIQLPFRELMERILRQSFHEVEALTGPGAERAAKMVGAKAFAAGNTVVLPESPTPALVAHELTHVAQQGAQRVEPEGDLGVTTPGDAAERQADAVADAVRAEEPAPPIQRGGEPTPRLARFAEADAQSESEAEVEAEAEEEGSEDVADRVREVIDPDERPLLFRYAVDVAERDETLRAHLEPPNRDEIVAAGLARWRQAVVDDRLFLRQLAEELGDEMAIKKLEQLDSDWRFDESADPIELKAEFVGRVARMLLDPERGYLDAESLYDEEDSAFTKVVEEGRDAFCRKGVPLEVPEGHPFLHRTIPIDAFWANNARSQFREDWEERLAALVDEEHHGEIGLNPGEGAISAYDYWAYKVGVNEDAREAAYRALDREAELSGGNGSTWWSYQGIELEDIDTLEIAAHLGWRKAITLGNLSPEHYEEGAVRLLLDVETLNARTAEAEGPVLRKPTVFDGMLSPRYEPDQLSDNQWGVTAGGTPEAVAPSLPAELIAEGSEGVRPQPAAADQLFDRLKAFIDAHGNADGKAEFGRENEPFPVSIRFSPGRELDIVVPGGERGVVTAPPTAQNQPGVYVAGAEVDIGEDGLRGGKALVDVDGDGAFGLEGAELEIEPNQDGSAQAETRIDRLKSRLEDVLGRLETEANLTDTGIEATMTLEEGETGIPGFEVTEGSEIKVNYDEEEGVDVRGGLGIAHTSEKAEGHIDVRWDGAQWRTRAVAEFEELVEGLEPVSVEIERVGDQIDARASDVEYNTQLGSIGLQGVARELHYDVNQESFGGLLEVNADLGMFGHAGASARLADNQVEQLAVSLESAELTYPREGEGEPIVRGHVGGGITYEDEEFAGNVNGHASLRLPDVFGSEDGAAGLDVDIQVNAEGFYTGTIRASSPITFGDYLRIDEAEVTLDREGEVRGEVSAELLGVPFLEEGRITWAIESGSVHIKEASARLSGNLEALGAGDASFELELTPDGITGKLTVAGDESGIPGISLEDSSIEFTYADGALSVQGELGISNEDETFRADVSLGWDDGWTFGGSATIDGLIPGIDEALTLHIERAEGGGIRIYADAFEYESEMGAIELEGIGENLEFDTTTGTFSGTIELEADLGLFGKVSGDALILENELERAELQYEAVDLCYPDSSAPILSGEDVTAELSFEDGKFSGGFSGTAKLSLPADLGGVGAGEASGLIIAVSIDEEGNYSGSIETEGSVELGTFLRIDRAKAELEENGDLRGQVQANVVNVPLLERGEIVCNFSKDGLEVESFDVEVRSSLEALGADRLEASVRLSEEGLEGALHVTEGPIGIPGFGLTESHVGFHYDGNTMTASGSAGLTHESGKFTGDILLRWSGEDWAITGRGTVRDLVDGLDPVTFALQYGSGDTIVTVAETRYLKELGAVTLEGQTTGLTYNVTERSFSGDATVNADLGMFGDASASATIVDNRVDVGELTYDSPKMEYPKGDDSPLVEGTIGGSIRYNRGEFSGTLRSDATLNIPGLASADDEVGVQVRAGITEDGKYHGTIQSTGAIQIGDYIRVSAIRGELTEEGDISSDFTVEVVNISFVDEGRLDCGIDENGFTVRSGSIEASFGEEGEDRAWGTLRAGYSEEEGIELGGDARVKVTDDIIAGGEFSYSSESNEVDASFTVDEITVFELEDENELFEFEKKIPVFNFYGIGLYVEANLSVVFDYDMNLALTPTITLEGLDLGDFSFDKAGGNIDLGGELSAGLDVTPSVGAGVFAVSPKLLSGGGSLRFEVSAGATLRPDASLSVEMTPDGELDGETEVAMPLTFGIDAQIVPSAEIDVLSGTYTKPWEGEPLAQFEILPETEIFNFQFDLGKDFDDQEPDIPEEPQAPGEKEADTILEQEEPVAEMTEEVEPEERSEEPSDDAEEDEGGFDIGQLIDGIKEQDSIRGVMEVVEAAGRAWQRAKDAVADFIGMIVRWVGDAVDKIVEALEGIAEHGLFGYLNRLMEERLGENTYYIVEPLLSELENSENELLDLFDRDPPSGDVLRWAIEFLFDFFGVAASSLSGLAQAIPEMFSNGRDVAANALNSLVEQGRLGVRRHRYWRYRANPLADERRKYWLAATEYKIFIPGVVSRHDKASGRTMIGASSAVGLPLWEVLERFSDVEPTNTRVDSKSGDAYNDYWVGDTSEPEPEPAGDVEAQRASFMDRYREMMAERMAAQAPEGAAEAGFMGPSFDGLIEQAFEEDEEGAGGSSIMARVQEQMEELRGAHADVEEEEEDDDTEGTS